MIQCPPGGGPQEGEGTHASLNNRGWIIPVAYFGIAVILGMLAGSSSRLLAGRLDTAAVQEFLLSVVSSETVPFVRQAAVESVGYTDARLHAAEKQAVLLAGLKDPVPQVRMAALESAGRLKCAALRDPIRDLSERDESEKVRESAARALRALDRK